MKTSTLMKLLFIALSLVLVISLVACTGEPTVDPEGSDSSVEESDPNDETPSDESQDPTPNESEDSSDDSDETPDTPACEHVEEEIPAIAATCTTDGATAGKKCSVCGEVLTAPTTIPATGHTEEEIPAVAPTCTEDGTTAGKKCSVCDTVLETPTTVPAGHTEEEIPAVAPTCTEDGTTAGKKCSECGEVLETPTTDPATGHNKVDKAYTAATTQEEGWLAHKYCEACGTAWDAEDNEIDVPTINKLEPTTNVYLGFEELKGKAMGGAAGSLWNTPEASADRTYVRFSRAGQSSDGSIMLLEGNTEVTGQYFVIKYRTDHAGSGEFWANTTANSHSDGKANYTASYITDGQWHIAIVDLAQRIPTYVKANDEGQYIIQWARIDMLNGSATEGYFDIAYIVFTDDLSKVTSVVQEGDTDLCPHHAAAEPTYVEDGDTHYTTCVLCSSKIVGSHGAASGIAWDTDKGVYTGTCVCGKEVTDTVLYRTEASLAGTNNCITATQEDGFVRYTVDKGQAEADVYAHIYRYGTAVTGKYMIITYRMVNGDVLLPTHRTWFAGSLAGGNTGAAGNGDNKVTRYNHLVADGEWHTMVVSIPDENTKFTANDDGTYTWAYLRVGFNPAAYDGSCYLDIAEIAFCDNIEAAEKYSLTDNENPVSVNNLDQGNCSLNGEVLTPSIRGNYAPIVLDLEGKTVENPASGLQLGGWCCTPGGVDAYYIRVTEVNGEAVAEPTLGDMWHDGDNRSDIYTAAGKSYGYSDTCATGAGFGKQAVDLSAYAGKTVSFELVAINNYGAEIVVVQVNNVSVKDISNDPNYVIDAKALAVQTEHTGLTYALDESGEFVTYTQKTDGSADCYAYVTFPDANINVPTSPTGQYVIIKYRTTYDDRIEIFAGANNGSTGAIGSVDNFSITQKDGNTGSLIADGEWQYVILALHEIIGDFNKPTNAFAPEDGTEDTFILDYLRLDFFNSATTTTKTVDVAYVAYADSVEKLVNYAGMDSYTYVDGYSGGVVYQTVVVNEAE